jgi:hypothetical protein
MSISWYSITILEQSELLVVFNGYFSVNNTTTTVTGFYETINGSTNFENNILGPSTFPWPFDDYTAENTYRNNYWGEDGTNISSVTLQTAYNFDTPYFNIYNENILWHSGIDLTNKITITSISDPTYIINDIQPKIRYCANKQPSTSSRTVATCSSVQYNKLNTGGNDPTISKKMLYSQMVRSNTYKTGFFK